MPSSVIVITQNAVAGTAGRSRDDLVTGLSVTLTNNDNTGVYSHRWFLLDIPTGSAATLNNSTSAVCTFVPDVEGTYRIQLSVNEGNISGQTQVRLAAVRNTDGTRYFAYAEKGEEINWLIDGDVNERGRVRDHELWLAVSAASRASLNNIFEVDFSAQSTQDFVASGDDVYTIDGTDWTVENTPAAGTFRVRANQGIEWAAAISTAGTLTTAAQTAPLMWIALEDQLFLDPSYNYVFDLYLNARTLENNLDGIRFGIWGLANSPTGSAIRMRLGGLQRVGGLETPITIANATLGSAAAGTTHTVLSFLLRPDGVGQISSAHWDAGEDTWPASAHAALGQPTALVAADVLYSEGARFVIAFNSASDASPTSTITVERLRIRRV